jgi:hypothetical protein
MEVAMAHRDVELDLPRAKTGKLYIDENGRWVVHVFPDLASTDDEAQDLARALAGRMGRDTGYDGYQFHFRDGLNAQRAPRPEALRRCDGLARRGRERGMINDG